MFQTRDSLRSSPGAATEGLLPSSSFSSAFNDMGYAILDELRNQGYNRPSIEDLVTLGHHGVQFDYVRGLGSLGYRVGSTDRLQELRDHGVTPAFISGDLLPPATRSSALSGFSSSVIMASLPTSSAAWSGRATAS